MVTYCIFFVIRTSCHDNAYSAEYLWKVGMLHFLCNRDWLYGSHITPVYMMMYCVSTTHIMSHKEHLWNFRVLCRVHLSNRLHTHISKKAREKIVSLNSFNFQLKSDQLVLIWITNSWVLMFLDCKPFEFSIIFYTIYTTIIFNLNPVT